jgi:hypothetical protein
VHSGAAAEQSTSDVNAVAYTAGHDIVFGGGRFAPWTEEGRRLIAHELTHVMQQTDPPGVSPISAPSLGAPPRTTSEADRSFPSHPSPARPYAVQQRDTAPATLRRQAATTPPKYEEIAKAVKKELSSLFYIDNQVIASQLKSLNNDPIHIEAFKETYHALFGQSVEAEIEGRMSAANAALALKYLRPTASLGKAPSKAGSGSTGSFAPAHSFPSLVHLIRAAEDALIAGGYYDMNQRLKILRGIYYGTTWSMDFKQEKSEIRNAGFDVYTASISRPVDPQPILGQSLFLALRASAEVTDGGRKVDVGHLFIGMESRTSVVSRAMPLPQHGGGTGLESVTWLGDIGGGTGMLAMRRAEGAPSKAKSLVYNASGNDYGAQVNLEGDIGAYLVSSNKSAADKPSDVQVGKYSYLADAIADYLMPNIQGKTSDTWGTRAKLFAQMLGAEFDAADNIRNEPTMSKAITSKLRAFGDNYAFARLMSHNSLTPDKSLKTSKNLGGAAAEVATIFIDILQKCTKDPKRKLVADLDLPITAPGDPVPGLLKNYYDVSQWTKDR